MKKYILAILAIAMMAGCKPKPEPVPEPDPIPEPDPAPHWVVTESPTVEAPQWQTTPTDDSPYSMTIFSKKELPDCLMAFTDVISVLSASGECLSVSQPKNIYLYLYVQQPSDEAKTFRMNYYSSNNKCYYVSQDSYNYVNDSQLGTADNMIEPEWHCCGQYPYLEMIDVMIVRDTLDADDEIAVFAGDECRSIGPVKISSAENGLVELSIPVPMAKVKEGFDVKFYDSRKKTIYTASNVEIGYQHAGVGFAIITCQD
ncbi:MAG: hypothetical protein MJZ58_00510 [Paludibacteraceae bacterium]|nr:hypothetical protein [Paludibacteraceae bacterium]